ncbi:MAG TPA: hypothetical protein VKZ87_03845 [Ferrovibrio sp.]|uniref:hypothetical protein n=1 Tax=Ferrovibrio sp. TaxID=1917215 RepID=UPI002B4B3D29|nr:hypothetical protein [Ferrovibrio sp.]HLT76500.1 hypothetical protein [Ferrovibrio sp.]
MPAWGVSAGPQTATPEVDIRIPLALRRHTSTLATAIVVVPVLVGLVYALWPGRGEEVFYTPGVTPSREECVMQKMKNYAKIDKPTLQAIAVECELTVQSIEGHEVMRKAWEARQATRPVETKPAPAPAPEPAPQGDTLRRVWR